MIQYGINDTEYGINNTGYRIQDTPCGPSSNLSIYPKEFIQVFERVNLNENAYLRRSLILIKSQPYTIS